MTTSKKILANLILPTFVLPTLAVMGVASTMACAPSGRSPSLAASPAPVTTTSSALDGRVFAVEGQNLPPGHPATIEVSFAGGMLDSSACRERGLAPIAYTVRDDGTFYAERRTPDTLDRWTGRVTGSDIEGLYTSEQAGATTMRIPFRGRAR
jgi:hypothetical protein